ncbi:hypothetical protein QFC20_004835 [Naganishia adeliensis]|uniref:Uncharacterized protein n=1 Tax=Naganishia adeliensis TaxID=92952 RepID=A0ACC2VV61_9TREE|nr:hypothetical protein QFC20_004835 [Naganishia adeliensis]
MTIYALYIYDRHCECIYYHDWHQTRKLQPPRDGGQRKNVARYEDVHPVGEVEVKQQGEGRAQTTVAGLPFDEQAKPEEQFIAYRTSTYKFHLYTTPTNLSFIMLSDPLADSLRGVLRQIYAGPFVQCVVRNPLVDWENGEEGERSGVDNDAKGKMSIPSSDGRAASRRAQSFERACGIRGSVAEIKALGVKRDDGGNRLCLVKRDNDGGQTAEPFGAVRVLVRVTPSKP